jgi:hypothetical protein
MTALNFVPEIIWASGEDTNGDIRTVKIENTNTNQELNFIPNNFRLAGKDNNGNIRVIRVGTDGSWLFN